MQNGFKNEQCNLSGFNWCRWEEVKGGYGRAFMSDQLDQPSVDIRWLRKQFSPRSLVAGIHLGPYLVVFVQTHKSRFQAGYWSWQYGILTRADPKIILYRIVSEQVRLIMRGTCSPGREIFLEQLSSRYYTTTISTRPGICFNNFIR